MSGAMRPQFPKTLEELETIIGAALVEAGIAHNAAEVAAEKSIERIRHIYGGELVYIAMGLGYDTARRNGEIRRRIDAGEAPDRVRREFSLSERQMRRILGRR